MDSATYIVVASILTVLGYVYWRKLKQRLNSAFKAYDILFITLILGYAVGKIMWQLQYSPSGLSLGVMVDPRRGEISYLAMLFLPLFAYQLRMQWGDRERTWKQHAMFVMVYSYISLLVITLVDLVVRIINSSNIDWLVVILILVMSILSLIYVARRHTQVKSVARLLMLLLFLQQIAVQVIVWLSSARSEYKILLAIGYFGLMLIPAIGLSRGNTAYETTTNQPRI